MKHIPQTMMDTLARLAIEFDRTAELDSAVMYREKADPGSTHLREDAAIYYAGWSAGKTCALEEALRALVLAEEWESTAKRWCETYERLEQED